MPVTYPFVPVPQIDPLGSLSDLMSLASQFQGLSDRSRDRRASEEATRREGMIREVGRLTQGDPAAYAREVGLIDPEQGRRLQAEVEQRSISAADRKQREFADMVQRIDRAEGVYGKAAQLFQEATEETWPTLYPRAVELATSSDPERGPELAKMIPKEWNPAQVQEILASVMQVHGTLTRFKKASQQFIGDGNPVEGLSEMLQLMETDAERDQILEKARYFGMPDEQITLAQRQATKAREQAATAAEGRGGEFYQNMVRPEERRLGRRVTKAETLRLREEWEAAGRTEEDRTAARQAETWLANELRDLEARRTPVVDQAGFQTRAPISVSDYARERNAIYDGYQRMTGREHPSRAPRRAPPWEPPRSPEGRPRLAAPPLGPSSAAVAPPASPPATAPLTPTTQHPTPSASTTRPSTPSSLPPGRSVMVNGRPVEVTTTPTVGKIIALKDGRFVLVTTVDADGHFDGDELIVSQ